MSVLDEIFSNKRIEVEHSSRIIPLAELRSAAEAAVQPPDFLAALRKPPGARPRLIAEVKHASPSRGVLIQDFDPIRLATIYQQNGAAAISVLTDQRYFQGCLKDLAAVATLQPGLPVLRKDFIFSPYQIYEARAAGASAILLIVAMFETGLLRDLLNLAGAMNLSVLMETHSKEEIDIALSVGATLIGINNRNLHDLSVNMETTYQVRSHVPASICLVAESGIHTRSDVDRLNDIGIDAILVGEALVTAADTAAMVRSLAG
jgi:indole-3-glycerol phosphate synthase